MKSLFFALLVSQLCIAAKEIELSHESTIETGVHFQVLLPNILPSFPRSLGVYGPYVGIPIGRDAIQLQAFYGKSQEQTATLVELSYRYHFRTPFFTAQMLAGPHFIRSAFGANERSQMGAHVGFGFTVPFSKTFKVGVGTKLYFQDRPIVSFGGGFGIFL